ncbi:hypothetical protein [Legionella cardiaca]|uniref:Uncharacterized protein n=1 Tax=Legionella cardiaca TaxID=1071983 RepID=A0ABY8AT07_9GAMM|nr:hypothetical protein [Legionella cardiaca]WED43802.1 hypothetical protein PXX05_03205 [Legionella cardiaca]
MPMFEDLLRDAKNFSESLTRALATKYSCGSLFCLPTLPSTELLNDAFLIQKTAECLCFYKGETHTGVTINQETKRLVLIGIYAYIWYQYDSALQWFLNKPLLELLQEHLGIESLSQLDIEIYKKSLLELENFCYWVYAKSNHYQQINSLFELFPTNMQGNLYSQKRRLNSTSSWGTSFSGLMTKIGISSLF